MKDLLKNFGVFAGALLGLEQRLRQGDTTNPAPQIERVAGQARQLMVQFMKQGWKEVEAPLPYPRYQRAVSDGVVYIDVAKEDGTGRQSSVEGARVIDFVHLPDKLVRPELGLLMGQGSYLLGGGNAYFAEVHDHDAAGEFIQRPCTSEELDVFYGTFRTALSDFEQVRSGKLWTRSTPADLQADQERRHQLGPRVRADLDRFYEVAVERLPMDRQKYELEKASRKDLSEA